MSERLFAHVRAATRPLFATALLVAPIGAWAQAPAQAPRRDTSARADSSQRLERVQISAIRAAELAPIAQKTIGRDGILARHFGQDVPLLLQAVSPSLTAHTETGTSSGYSYLRLRGLDQTRINVTIDGVPLNDMEDQVLYFANFADLMGSVQSVQVQRGVGTSTAGTASFAGSVNFETMPLAGVPAGGDATLQLGSWRSQRASASVHTGLTESRWALYARGSALRTNGYRDHSGVSGRSALLAVGWFGARTVVKATALVGLLADTLSYVGATSEELRTSRRFNPLSPDELDRFGQQMVALSLSHALADGSTLNTTVYRNSASGHYDYNYPPDRYRYGLAHAWYGATSAVTIDRGLWQVRVGANGNTYQRSHRAFLQPLVAPLYDNTGQKQDASAFVKVSLSRSRVQWFADMQARWTRFRYVPDAAATIAARDIAWAFFNPKIGATVRLADAWSAFASYGATTREPTRSDLLAGEDDLNSTNVADYGDFTRVKPETVRDAELGARWAPPTARLTLNAFSMDFRNDIARIGAPTASGSVLRRNVGASYRRGVEADGEWSPTPRFKLTGSATLSRNRIQEFTDSSRGTPEVLRHVQPLLTPQFLTTHGLELAPTARWAVSVDGRYQSNAFLDNTGSADRALQDFYVLSASTRVRWTRFALTVRGENLGDTQKFGSGSAGVDGVARYFVLPARAVYASVDVTF